VRKNAFSVMSAVRTGLDLGAKGSWSGDNTVVRWEPKSLTVDYRGNRVFKLDKETGRFWVDACGFVTNKSVTLMNASLEGARIPYRMAIRGKKMCASNVATGDAWAGRGGGRLRGEDFEKAGLGASAFPPPRN